MIFRSPLNFLQLDRLSIDSVEGNSRDMETDNDSATASFPKDCPDTEDSNHPASDTSDLKQGLYDLSLF